MGAEVIVYTKNHRIDSLDTVIKYQGETEEKPVYIGDDCWIYARSIILPGVCKLPVNLRLKSIYPHKYWIFCENIDEPVSRKYALIKLHHIPQKLEIMGYLYI